MTKQEYLNLLRKELKSHKIADAEEIIKEYEQHFDYKLNEGRTEEEVTAKMELPNIIAEQFIKHAANEGNNGYRKMVIGICLGFLDVIATMVYILIWGCVAVLGIAAVTFFALGIELITTINIANLIPSIPYIGGFLMGLSSLALGTIISIGTIYAYNVAIQVFRAYLRWHQNILNMTYYPSISIFPQLSKRFSIILKKVGIMSLMIFVVLFIVGFLVLVVYAGNIEFWHEWNWFG